METVSPRFWTYLQLARPANVVTAWADILAGFAVAGATLTLEGWTAATSWPTLVWLLLATTGLYAGGVVLNDVFDAELDAVERPERPIPSGRASRRNAALFGGVLLLLGIVAAALAGLVSAVLAALIACAVVLYDARAKHHALFGPLTMGACRGANLLLGVSAVPAMLTASWYLALIPIAYIAAITTVSRGEVHGGTRGAGYLAVALVAGVIASLLFLGVRADYRLLQALPFVALFAVQVIPKFLRAAHRPDPKPIRRAVKAGVMALIPLNAALAAGFSGWLYGLGVLALLLLSMGLARLFAVT